MVKIGSVTAEILMALSSWWRVVGGGVKSFLCQTQLWKTCPDLMPLDTLQTPLTHLPDTSQILTRHLTDTLQPPCRNLVDTLQIPFRDFQDTLHTPNRNPSVTHQTSFRHLKDNHQRNLEKLKQTQNKLGLSWAKLSLR